MAQYVVDRFGEAEGFNFFYKQSYTLSRHLQEIPELDGSVDHLLTWCERRERVGNARVLPTTFGRKRRGNVFM
jgi:hypothetical protein